MRFVFNLALYFGYVLLWSHRHEDTNMRMLRTDHYDRRNKY